MYRAEIVVGRQTMMEVNKNRVLDANECYREGQKGSRIINVESESYNFKYGCQEILNMVVRKCYVFVNITFK